MTIIPTIETKEGYVILTANGKCDDFNLMIQGTHMVNEAAKEYGVKHVLLDHRNLSYDLNMSEAFNLVKVYEKDFPSFSGISITAVVNEDGLELAKFWESICLKRGYQSKVFLDFDKAEQWVISHSKVGYSSK